MSLRHLILAVPGGSFLKPQNRQVKPAIPHTRRNLLETALGLGCILASALPSAHAATLYWDGTSAGWDAVANWSTVASADNPDPAAVPGAADDVIFNIDPVDGAVTVGLNAAQSAQSLTFNNTGTTALQGGGTDRTLALGAGGILMDAAAGAATIGSATAGQGVAITLSASQTWTNNSAATLAIANPFTSAAGIGLTKAGTGNVAMTNAANTTNIGGTLDVQAGKFLMSGDVTVGGLTGAGTIENGGAASKWFFLNNAADNVFSGSIKDQSATVRLGLVKGGVGMLTLSGTNNLGDNFAIANGLVKVTGTTQAGVGGANGQVSVGSVGNQNGRLLIEGGTLNATKNTSPSVGIGTAANSQGFLKMTSGSITTTSEFHVGRAQSGSFSAYTQTGGTLTSGNWLVVGLNNDRAVFNQSGGSVQVNTNRATLGAGGNNSIGVVSLSGGTFNVAAGNNSGIFLGENGTAILNLSGSAAMTFATNGGANSGTMQFAGNAASLAGHLNLVGGTLTTFGVTKGASTGTGVYRFNFNGGTLKAQQANTNFFADLANTDAYIFPGGGTVDNNGAAITITEALKAPTGNGVSATGLSVSGGGYLDTPIVTITGGGGTGATAVATIDASGNLTGIQITNPGINYTTAPTFALVGGGVGNTGAITGTATLVANTSGGMTFTGSGTTTLGGANTFTGPVAVNAGKLGTGGTYASSAFTVASTAGIVVAQPGSPIGTLTVPSLSLASGASATFETNGTTSDKIVVSNAGGLSFGTLGINLYDSGTTNGATPGTYTLFEYTGSLTGSIANLSVLNPRVGFTYTFANTGSAITVQVVNADTDGDGMSDAYETANGLDPNDATGVNGADGNLDGDFATNYEEFLAGTAANNSASDPLNTDNDGLLDSWETTHFGNIAAQTGTGDFDGDFDSNLLEFTNGTTPTAAASFSDTDTDGMGDGWEILYFGNIAAKDGTVDSDSDLFTDLQEYDYGSDPTDSSFSPVQAKAAHRWSFTGNLNDSVGTSNATIENGTTSNTNVVTQNPTSVTLAGGVKADSQWVKLGSQLLPARNTPVTIETWATVHSIQNFSRIWDFHNSTTENLYMSWSVGTGALTDRIQWVDPAGLLVDNTNSYALATKYHIVMTIEPAATPGSSVVKWYSAPEYDGVTNLELGAARGTATVANSLAFMNDTINALGFSPWNDNTANATYDEFRLWDGAMPRWALEGMHKQGTDNAAQADSDTDQLPDAYEEFYFGDLTQAAAGDSDGDLSSNIDELKAGSDPSDPGSSPNDSDADGLPDAWEIGYFGDLDETAGGDPDGDYAFNSEELDASTDPSLYTSFPDTDSDGMSDAWENFYFFGLSDDGTSDGDGDLVDSLDEFINKGDPTNPLSPGAADGDADNDGLPDRWETGWFGATTLTAQSGTGDADSDGANNLAEYQATSDPTDLDSTPSDINGDGQPDQHAFHSMSATGSGPQDKDGQATTFSGRLANTGTTIPTVDPNLDLDTTAGTLAMTTSSSDINGQVNMAELEALGIPLSSLGFTGNEDFRVRAHFVNLPALDGFDQIGAYVGTSSTAMTRAGAIRGSYQSLGVNTNGTNDANAFFGANGTAGAAGTDLTVEIERIGGVWTMACNGSVCTPGAQPEFLNGVGTLQAGVFVLDQNVHKTATLDSFTVVSFGAAGDSDSDNLPDDWEITYFGNTGAQTGTGDADADGTNNRTEYLLGLDPTNGSQRFAAAQSNVVPGTGVTLTWPAQNGLTFQVSRSTTLGTWTPIGGVITATGTTATYTDNTAPLGKAFYRVDLTTP
jgi:autotransporter-associated beta strand protein